MQFYRRAELRMLPKSSQLPSISGLGGYLVKFHIFFTRISLQTGQALKVKKAKRRVTASNLFLHGL
jgi:hypothetical protein